MISEKEKTYFEYCSICESLYDFRGRKQHLRTRKHCRKVCELNLEDTLIPVEHFSLTLEGEIEINED